MGDRLVVGLRTLTPSAGVRIPLPQPDTQKARLARVFCVSGWGRGLIRTPVRPERSEDDAAQPHPQGKRQRRAVNPSGILTSRTLSEPPARLARAFVHLAGGEGFDRKPHPVNPKPKIYVPVLPPNAYIKSDNASARGNHLSFQEISVVFRMIMRLQALPGSATLRKRFGPAAARGSCLNVGHLGS